MYTERFRGRWLSGNAVVALESVGESGIIVSDGDTVWDTCGGEPLALPGVTVILQSDDATLLGTGTEVIAVHEGAVVERLGVGAPVVALVDDYPLIVVASDGLYEWDMADAPRRVAAVDAEIVAALSDGIDAVWMAARDRLYCWTPEGLQEHRLPGDLDASGTLDIRDIAADDAGSVWAATSAGLLLFSPPDGWKLIRGEDGLPIENLTHVSLGADGELWTGSPDGVSLWTEDSWEYYAGLRWLADDSVTALCPRGSSVWVGTSKGACRIERREFTLEAKAELFEKQVDARHNRRGYVTVCFFEKPGDLTTYRHEASDNDGLWTALYVAAESYRYAVTRSDEAREKAARSMDALLRLEEITPISGFPARATMFKDEPKTVQSGGEWHDASDGVSIWKADTSSDEIDGHVYAFSVYHDLVADEAEKQRIVSTMSRIAGHILDNGYYLIDMDGLHTRWGVWAPERLNGDWKPQQGLNSLEMLCILKTAWRLTDEDRFIAAYDDLVRRHHYALNTIDQKLTAEGWVNHSDDELAFLSYYPLLKYENNPHLRRIYLMSLERSWQIERPERCPLWNAIYGALSGNPCDVEASIRTLQEIPTDLVSWRMRNRHRDDLKARTPPGGWTEQIDPEVLPYFERSVHKWNGNPFRLDGGDAGGAEEDGTVFLLPYWMSRYYGFVKD